MPSLDPVEAARSAQHRTFTDLTRTTGAQPIQRAIIALLYSSQHVFPAGDAPGGCS
jgi:hypothetical protein